MIPTRDEFLSERLGVAEPVKRLADLIYPRVWKAVNELAPKSSDELMKMSVVGGYRKEFVFRVPPGIGFPVERMEIGVHLYSHFGRTGVGGAHSPGKVPVLDVSIAIDVRDVDSVFRPEVRLETEIKSTLLHELTHAYEDGMRMRSGSAISLTRSKAFDFAGSEHMIPLHPLGRLLMALYYLASYEINARVASAHAYMDGVEGTANRLAALKSSEVWRTMVFMKEYSADDVRALGKYEMEDLVDSIQMGALKKSLGLKQWLEPDMYEAIDKKVIPYLKRSRQMSAEAFLRQCEKKLRLYGEEFRRNLLRLV